MSNVPDRSIQEDQSYRQRQYVSLLSSYHQRIYGYILMLVPRHSDADDIMQETSLVMFEKFDNFKLGTDFLAWATVIARYQILRHFKDKKRDKVVFDQELVEILSGEVQERIDCSEEWVAALQCCVERLEKSDRQLLKLHYHERIAVKVIAKRLDKSFQQVYRAMSRINGLLMRCVRKSLCEGGL